MTYSNSDSTTNGSYAVTPEFAERGRNKQARLTSALKSDTTLSSAGRASSGSLVARRLAENADVSGRFCIALVTERSDGTRIIRTGQFSSREDASQNPHLTHPLK
jgi:hypothetical protein